MSSATRCLNTRDTHKARKSLNCCVHIKQRLCMLARALCCVLLLSAAACLPVHTTSSNATLALVLCRGLDAAVRELRERELAEHVLGAAWLERDCVSIDPCFQESSNADHYGNLLPAPAGVWLSGNSSALLLPLGAERLYLV